MESRGREVGISMSESRAISNVDIFGFKSVEMGSKHGSKALFTVVHVAGYSCIRGYNIPLRRALRTCLEHVSEIACHPFGHLRDLIAFAGSHCLPVGYFILWDFGSVLWDACGLLELVSWVRSTCWTADQNAHQCKLLSHSRPALLTPSVPVAPMGAGTSRLLRALRSRQTW
jgi:hypothetical protein